MRSILLTSAVLVLSFAPLARADGPEVVGPAKAEGIVFEPGTPKFEDVLAKAKAAGKPVFADFTTDWCGWCRKLEKDTFSQASVGELMKSLVNVQIDAEKGEGPELKARYGVSGYPTLVIIDSSGEEIDRIVGYKKPEAFTAEIERILRGEGTIAALRKKWAESPDDLEAGRAVGAKLASSNPSAAVDVYAKLLELPGEKSHETEAALRLDYAAALLGARKNDAAMSQAESLLRDFADTPSAAEVGSRLGRAFVAGDAKRALAFLDAARALAKEPKELVEIEDLTVAVHKNGIAAALKRQAVAAGEDPQTLNSVAWTCFELRVNVRDALGWAKTAVEKSNRDPAILDTLANLLWITGKRAEAIQTEVEASEKAALEPTMASMKRDFDANIAKWRAEVEAAKPAAESAK